MTRGQRRGRLSARLVARFESEPARRGSPPPLTSVPTGRLRVGRVADQPVLGEVPQVPARHRGTGADVRREPGRRRRTFLLQVREDREPDGMRKSAHTAGVQLDVAI